MRRILTVAFLLCIAAPAGAEMSPAIDAVSLMDQRFYEQRGAFMIEHLQLVFPQQATGALRLVIRSAAGAEVAAVDLRKEEMGFEAFSDLRAQGPGILEVGQPGAYVIGVEHEGTMLTSFSFTMRVDTGDDPYNPKKSFTRVGPWSELAYLAQPTGEPDRPLTLHWWSRLGQTPGVKHPQCTAELARGGSTVARTHSPISVGTEIWQHLSRSLATTAAKKGPFTQAMLTAQDGTYTVAVDCAGKRVRTYSLQVKDGRVVEIPRTQLGHQPPQDFLAPRRIDTSSGSGSRYKMENVFWMQATP